MNILVILVALLASAWFAQTNAPSSENADPLKALSFLEGTWQAKTQGGSAGAETSGTYVFQRELKSHVLARHSQSSASCKGPAAFDCEHNDLFYVYVDPERPGLKAIYFDNEGHVIHYDVSVPDSATAIFQSDGPGHGPQFRLIYELRNAVMSGKFQMRVPGQKDWKSYLEWSGPRQM